MARQASEDYYQDQGAEILRNTASQTCGSVIGPVTRLALKQSQTSTNIPAGTLNATGSPVFIWMP